MKYDCCVSRLARSSSGESRSSIRADEGKYQPVSTPVPPPHYTLIKTSRGDDPAIIVVNSALRGFDQRSRFPWHLSVLIDCEHVAQNGMPSGTESEALYRIEDEISGLLLEQQNAVFLARITCRGRRELLFRVDDPELADQLLRKLLSAPTPLRAWEYRMDHDEAWDLARPELQLLEKDPKYN